MCSIIDSLYNALIYDAKNYVVVIPGEDIEEDLKQLMQTAGDSMSLGCVRSGPVHKTVVLLNQRLWVTCRHTGKCASNSCIIRINA